MKPVLFASAALSLLATPALADGIVDNVNGLTITEGGKIVRFKAILVDKDGRVTRLVPPGGGAPQAQPQGIEKECGQAAL